MKRCYQHHHKYWVSAEFRNLVQDRYGIVKDAHWNLLQYMLFDGQRLKENDEGIVMNYELVQFLCGSNDSAYDLLMDFETCTGIQMNLSPYYMFSSTARTVCPEIAPEITNALRSEFRRRHRVAGDKVLFRTGEPYSDYKWKKARKELLDHIMGQRLSEDKPTRELVEYLHSHRVQMWLQKQVEMKADQVYEAIFAMPEGVSKEYAHRVFHRIEQYAYIEYKACNNTARINAIHDNILSLPADLRNIFFGGCYNLDLKAAQLCIIADLWDLPQMKAFLKEGKSIWAELLGFIGQDASAKPQVKDFLYAAVYGMPSKGLNGLAKHDIGTIGPKLLRHPLMDELLVHRDRRLRQIFVSRGGCDCWGHFICTDNVSNRATRKARSQGKSEYDIRRIQARSVLATIVQSYEVEIMLAGFEEIRNNDNLLLAAFLHDGCFIKVVNHAEHAERYLDRVNNAIVRKGHELGIEIESERELL